MTEDTAVQWIAFAARRPVEDVLGLELDDIQAVKLGRWLSENRLLNPPKKVVEKIGQFRCQCGCGQLFMAAYRTKKPKYVNDTHKMRAYRARQSAR